MVHKHFICWYRNGCRFGYSYYHKADYPKEVKETITSRVEIPYSEIWEAPPALYYLVTAETSEK